MADPSFDPGTRTVHFRRWVLVVPMLGLLGMGVYTLLHTNPSQPDTPMEKHLANFIPQWQPVKYEAEPAPVPDPPRPDHTQELLAQLTQQQEALRKELAALRASKTNRPVETRGEARTAGAPPKKRKHASMLFIDHPPPDTPTDTRPQYLLGAGTYVKCVLENVLNSDVPGFFTVKTTAPLYDTETGRHLLMKQNQSIVGKDEAETLLFGNSRIPTFALTLSNADGTSIDLGSMPVMDQRGTNGLSGRVDNKIWKLVWSSLLIGGLRGGQQALQAAAVTGNPAGSVAVNVTGELSQAGQSRLGRAVDTRPEIEVAAGTPCVILLTKAIELPEIRR